MRIIILLSFLFSFSVQAQEKDPYCRVDVDVKTSLMKGEPLLHISVMAQQALINPRITLRALTSVDDAGRFIEDQNAFADTEPFVFIDQQLDNTLVEGMRLDNGGRYSLAFDLLKHRQEAVIAVYRHAYDDVLNFHYIEVDGDYCRPYVKTDIFDS